MSSVLDDLATYLQDQNVGTVATDIFLGRAPTEPDDLIALYEYSGLNPEFTHDNPQPFNERPRVQVKARAKLYENGRTKIEAAYRALNQISNQMVNGTRYYRALPLQPPFYLRHDDNERVEFIVNYQIFKGVSP